MAKLRTIIADDEMLALKLLRASLQGCPDIDLLAECKNGREAVQASKEQAPDLLFLDIHMPGMGGFDVVRELQSIEGMKMPIIVFCTAHQRFALDVFDSYAIDYLLKPLDDCLLERIVQRAVHRFHAQAVSGKQGNERRDSRSKTAALMAAIATIENLIKKLESGTATVNSTRVGDEPTVMLGEDTANIMDMLLKKGKFSSSSLD